MVELGEFEFHQPPKKYRSSVVVGGGGGEDSSTPQPCSDSNCSWEDVVVIGRSTQMRSDL